MFEPDRRYGKQRLAGYLSQVSAVAINRCLIGQRPDRWRHGSILGGKALVQVRGDALLGGGQVRLA
ncbi:hypothetical protein, partial [Sandaracinobacter sp.]|uniref:hypothetical protein n=1 Tax=Sandaracinobacter sp. TaxID=2487581 RepID=UPI0035B38DF4